MLEQIFKAYDIRGIVPDALDERAAHAIGVGVARHLRGQRRGVGGAERGEACSEECSGTTGDGPDVASDPFMIVVGRDMRRHSPALARALMDGMLEEGAEVVDIGRVDTPLVGFTVRALGAAGGVQVTASHNPAEYNGFKICGPGALPVGSETGLLEIRRLALEALRASPHAGEGSAAARSAARVADPFGGDSPAAAARPPVPLGVDAPAAARTHSSRRVRAHDPWPAYRECIRGFLPPAVLAGAKHPLHVVVDASNGMAGAMLPRIFDALPGLEILPIHFDNDHGEFVHEPNPLVQANLRWTCEAVRAHGADFGVCFDGDADRCMVVDERGVPVGCDLLTAWLAARWLRKEPGAAIVFDLRSTRAVRETIAALGGTPVECRVGHVFMKSRLRETGAPFGGELSGHFYYRDMGATDCGARALADILAALSEAGQPMSACIAPFRRYAQSGEINFRCSDAAGALAALRAAHPHAHMEQLDGLTVDSGEWWCNVRASNTEPLLRLNVEARTAAEVEARVRALAPHLGTRVDH